MILYLVVWLSVDAYRCADLMSWNARRICERDKTYVDFFADAQAALKEADDTGGRIFKIENTNCENIGPVDAWRDCYINKNKNGQVQELLVIPAKAYEVIGSSFPVQVKR